MASHIDVRDTIPIPQPAGYPLIGNLFEIDPELPVASVQRLAKQYGEIFRINVVGKSRVVIASQRLMAEACDEKRFGKLVTSALGELRNGVHDGLFTAQNHEENWGLAHRILVPAFGPLNITSMFDEMKDIASQLVLKLARYGPEYHMPVADDFTRLTLDTLALCAMDYRFNSFYKDEMHPFIESMVRFLNAGGIRSRRPAFVAPLYRAEDRQFQDDIKYMRDLSRNIVNQRIEHPQEGKKDLLNAMVNGKDPKTGKKLSTDTIMDNMITFLVAGHETTSGLLSFLFYYLLKSPDAYRQAQEEVDRVIGTETIQEHHVNNLPYITACLREAIRLQPTAPVFMVSPQSEHGEVLGGKYYIPHNEPIVCLLHEIHRDPAVYGEDANEFRPERMLDKHFNELPPGAWKPFGNGARGCIGRPFAWQEALLVTAMLLQYFDFFMVDPSYDLLIKSSLTIKPKDFYMRAALREGWTATTIEQSLSGSVRSSEPLKDGKANAQAAPDAESEPLTILYGSNSGTCEAFAQTLAADAGAHGFKVTKIETLDSAKRCLPANEPVAIITASYEGQPTDNAAHFYNWLSTLADDEKVECSYAVFGCGHSDWKQTFHRIPNSINNLLNKHGGKRIADIGLADASKGDMMSAFQHWEDEIFWPAVQKQFGKAGLSSGPAASSTGLTIKVSNRRASQLRADVSEAKVIASRLLTAPGAPEKRHIEVQLPTDMTYRAGDYLAILPLNPEETVHRVMIRFGLPWDAMLTIDSKSRTALPTEHPISARDLFSAYLELSQPATKRDVLALQEASTDPKATKDLQAILDSDFHTSITQKRVSLLDLLERFPTINLPLGTFIASLIPLRIRQYSISSSPLAAPDRATLTYAVLSSPSTANTTRPHIGVASSYLSKLVPGDRIHVAVKQSHTSFHLPADPETTPILMLCAGTGIAPFRSFIQERAAMIGAGRVLAPAHLYYGCRDPEKDALYTEDLDRWERAGAVMVHRAYSQASDKSGGHKRIDTLVRADEDLVVRLWDDGARVYVCGSRDLGESVKKVCIDMARTFAGRKGIETEGTDEAAEKWFGSIRNERFSSDVFD